MFIQLALRFDEVPVTGETQQRYHSITPWTQWQSLSRNRMFDRHLITAHFDLSY